MTRKLIGTSIQLLIGESFSFAQNRRSLGCPLRLGLNECMQAAVAEVIHPPIIPFDDNLVSLCVSQDGQSRDVLSWFSRRARKQGLPISDYLRDGRVVEQIRVVGDGPKDTVSAVVEHDHQVELGTSIGDFPSH